MHTPVLLQEVLEYLDPKPGDFVIDGTVNGGGHAKAIFEKISPGGYLLGIDWDESLVEKLRRQSWVVRRQSSITLVNDNYTELPEILKRQKLPKADGLLLDLGFSSEQIEESKRGFSFNRDEPLYMTYSREMKPVAQVIRELTERELADVIFKLSGEKYSRSIAKAIKAASKKKRIISSLNLAEIIRRAVPKNYERGHRRGGASRINPATRTFQALRIYVNCELENLENLLKNLTEVLKPKGRAAIVSFHSLEDALVKDYFEKLERSGEAKILTKRPAEASKEETDINPRSRSAKLRALQII